ncbi:MAG: carbonic anhydrase [Actinomycetia bacterium]|nr:carbonic anhydrase [Actinomycetes bacterium]
MPITDRLTEDNVPYAQSFPGPAPKHPKQRLAVVTCMDARLDPLPALGLSVGDVHLIRNAGGLVTDDVLRSLAISQHHLGTREVAVIGHTDCGMLNFDDDSFRATLADQSGQAPGWRVPGFVDLAAEVRRGARMVRECPWLPHRQDVRGFIFEVATGRLTVVE